MRQTVKAIRLAVVDVVRDHQYHCLDCIDTDVRCECPESDYAFYKAKLEEAVKNREDALKVHAEHVAWAVGKALTKEDQ